MSYNYGPLASKAVALISKYGAQVTLTFDTTPSTPADSNKPWRGHQAGETAKTPKGVVSEFDKNEIDGDSILSTDIKLLVAGQDAQMSGVDIQMLKQATIDGIQYGAKAVETIRPAGTTMLYIIRLRQG